MSKKRRWSDDQLAEAVKISKSYANVLRILKLKDTGGNYSQLKQKVKKLKINTDHFTGQGWCVGENHKNFVKKFIEIPLEKILIKDSEYQNTNNLKQRLLKENLLENKCYECGMKPIWNNKPLTMRLDHIDGERTNNELFNLRLVCPNCDSQSETYCGRNIKLNRK